MAPAEESCHVKYKGQKASYFCVRLPGCMYCMYSHTVVKIVFGIPCGNHVPALINQVLYGCAPITIVKIQ